MKQFVIALTLLAGLAVAGAANAQSSGTSPSPSTDPSSASQSSPSVSGQSAQTGVLVDANAVIGATVRSQGKDIGKVERLMLDPKDGRVRTVVVQQGGTLGVGGKSIAMPWESVKVGQDGGKIIVTAEQQMLEQAPSASPRGDSKSDSKSDSSKK
jgi:sporulation protein YlmC with PRC-barrel domain